MIITNITQQKKNKTRYSIYVDEDYVCGVQDEVLSRLNLKKNMDVTPEMIERVRAEDQFVVARQLAVRYVYLRPRSRREIEVYLKKKDFPVLTIDRIVEYLTERGMLNDAEFAEKYVSAKLKYRTIGRLKLQRELLEKGVDKKTIDDVLARTVDEDHDCKTAHLLARKKLKQLGQKPYEKLQRSVYNYLIYHGIPSNIAQQVVGEAIRNAKLKMQN